MADSLLDDKHANVVAINYTLIYVFGTIMDLRWWYLGDSTLVRAIPDDISTFSFSILFRHMQYCESWDESLFGDLS